MMLPLVAFGPQVKENQRVASLLDELRLRRQGAREVCRPQRAGLPLPAEAASCASACELLGSTVLLDLNFCGQD